MILEVIATSLLDAQRAEAGGADRLELVADLRQGGLTPDITLVKQIVSAVKIPIHVMIRPNARSFEMSEIDVSCMIESIQRAEEAGASALVFGVLTHKHEVDRSTLDVLMAASSLPVTFHRAFDEIQQQTEALQLLLTYKQIRSVLTSGGAASVLDAVEQIRVLERMTRGSHLHILPGGGLTIDSLASFVQSTGVHCIHLGTAVREHNHVDGAVEEEKVKRARDLLDGLVRTNDDGGQR